MSQEVSNQEALEILKGLSRKCSSLENKCSNKKSATQDDLTQVNAWNKQAQAIKNAYFSSNFFKDGSAAYKSALSYSQICQQCADSVAQYYQLSKQNEIANQDTRTDDILNANGTITDPKQITNLGELIQYLKTQQGKGSDAIQGANLDALLSSLNLQTQLQWQTQSDDMAYQRTSFATRYQEFLAAGMSPAAAMAAASGSAASVAGSTLGGALTSGFANAAAVDADRAQNANLAQQQMSQNAAQFGMAQAQQQSQFQQAQAQQASQYQQTLQQNQAQFERTIAPVEWQFANEKEKIELITPVYEAAYTMQPNGVDIPETATFTTTTLKLWGRNQRDIYRYIAAGIKDGSLVQGPDDAIYLAAAEGDEEAGIEGEGYTYDNMVYDAQEYKTARFGARFYKEIEVLTHHPMGGLAYEEWFMSNAGPRAYHEQESVSQYMYDVTKYQIANQHLENVKLALEEQDTLAAAEGQFAAACTNLSSEQLSKVQEKLKHYNLQFDGAHVTYIDHPEKQITIWDLVNSGCCYLGFSQQEFLAAQANLQQLSLASDVRSYNLALSNQRSSAANEKVRLGIENLSYGKAHKWIQNSEFLTGAAALNVTLKATGLDKACKTGAFLMTTGAAMRFKAKGAAAAVGRSARSIKQPDPVRFTLNGVEQEAIIPILNE